MSSSSKPEKKKSLKPFKTEPKLSVAYCNQTFHNSLRTNDPQGHAETKMTFVPIKVNKCKDQQASHIFTGEDPKTIKVSRKPVGYIPSNVMFDDYYFEKNPRIIPDKKRRYQIEKQIQENDKHPFSDEVLIPKCEKNKLMQRKINEMYRTNPIHILDAEENRKNNEALFKKNENRVKVFNAFLGSKNYKRTLGGIRSKNLNKSCEGIRCKRNEGATGDIFMSLDARQINKVVNNDPDINKNAMIVNRDADQMVPHYAKSQFRYASCKHGNGYTYI